MIRFIPNIFTSLNLLCGCIAVLFVASGDFISTAVFIFLGIVFDFLDGLFARLLKIQNKVGVHLDSLADMITSGLAPALIIVQLLSISIGGEIIDLNSIFSDSDKNASWVELVPFIGLMIAVASGYRLAKFNVDDRQSDSFIGLPTPANAIFIFSLPLILEFQNSEFIESIIINKWTLIALTLISCILMNSEIHLFSLKFKTFGFKDNFIKYLFIILCVISLILLKFIAIPVIILLYIVLSLFNPKNS
jgi:CDP-diacylglycerol--serine O-phosphatidyltransferase